MRLRSLGSIFAASVPALVLLRSKPFLAALLLPALGKSKTRASQALCASNLRQWGLAVTTYAGDNQNAFPDNRDGTGLSWCGNTVQSGG